MWRARSTDLFRPFEQQTWKWDPASLVQEFCSIIPPYPPHQALRPSNLEDVVNLGGSYIFLPFLVGYPPLQLRPASFRHQPSASSVFYFTGWSFACIHLNLGLLHVVTLILRMRAAATHQPIGIEYNDCNQGKRTQRWLGSVAANLNQ